MSSHNNTRIISSSTDNSIRLWKIESNTQMVYRGRKMDQSMECCTIASYQNFITGDISGNINLFSTEKKKAIYSVKVGVGGKVDDCRMLMVGMKRMERGRVVGW